MATANVTNKSVTFEIQNEGDFDVLSRKLAMLSANLHVIYGEGFEAFSNLSDDIRENYIWGCSILADECRAIVAKNTGEVA